MARTEAPTTHGWYLDPKDPEQVRFWSGTAWTSLTKFPTADELAEARLAGDPSSGAPLPAPRPRAVPEDDSASGSRAASGARPATGGGSHREPGPTLKLFAENVYSDVTILLTLVYIAVAIAFGLVILSVVPALTSVASFRNREKAAFLSALAAAMAIVVGIGTRR